MKHCWKFQNLCWIDKCMCLFHRDTKRRIRKLSDLPTGIYLVILKKKIQQQKWKILMWRVSLWLLSSVFFEVTHRCWNWSKIKLKYCVSQRLNICKWLDKTLRTVNNKITIVTTLVVLSLAAHSDHLGRFLKIAHAYVHPPPPPIGNMSSEGRKCSCSECPIYTLDSSLNFLFPTGSSLLSLYSQLFLLYWNFTPQL